MDHWLRELERFYEIIKTGVSVGDFLNLHARLFPIKDNKLLMEYRLAKGKLKRLCDEVSPTARFVSMHASPDDRIQFPLDNHVPDCHIWHEARHRQVEITGAQRVARFKTMNELNDSGQGRGFLPGTDDTEDGFRQAVPPEREAYSTPEAQEAMLRAVQLCISKKKNSRGADTLLIEAPRSILRFEKWLEIQPKLSALTSGSAFSEIFLIGDGDEDNKCLRIR